MININNFSFKGCDKVVDFYYDRNEDNIILSKKIIKKQIYVPNLVRKWYDLGEEKLDKLHNISNYTRLNIKEINLLK